jgi:hypothetical protein
MRQAISSAFDSFAHRVRQARQLAQAIDLPHELTRLAVAFVLLTASLLKASALAEDYLAFGQADAMSAVLAAAELLGALLIVVRRPGVRLWVAYTALFCAFGAVSGYQAWLGDPRLLWAPRSFAAVDFHTRPWIGGSVTCVWAAFGDARGDAPLVRVDPAIGGGGRLDLRGAARNPTAHSCCGGAGKGACARGRSAGGPTHPYP